MKQHALLELLDNALGLPEGTFTREDTAETIEQWDSMGHLSILVMLKTELDIEIDQPAVQGFTSVEKLCSVLEGQGIKIDVD